MLRNPCKLRLSGRTTCPAVMLPLFLLLLAAATGWGQVPNQVRQSEDAPAASTSQVVPLPVAASGVGSTPAETARLPDSVVEAAAAWLPPDGLGTAIKTMLLLGVLSLVPAILLMTTSFVRIVVVLGLLRQALGTQMLPSNQVVTALAMFLTLLVMSPVWWEVYEQAIVPYTAEHREISAEQAWTRGIGPVRRFMSAQIEMSGSTDDVWLLYDYLPARPTEPTRYDDFPLQVLLPAFMLSELKTAFLLGFQIYLPFLVLDLVVSSVTASMGMFMLPPVMVSLPLKLLLFVLVDGWHLVVGMLLQSFAPVA